MFKMYAPFDFCGDYNGETCPMCGRERVMADCQDGKRHCEKCDYNLDDEEFQRDYYPPEYYKEASCTN